MNVYYLGDKIDAKEVGNKAAFLSYMKSNGFNVPSGIVLGADVFSTTVSENKNKKDVDLLLKNLNTENVDETAKKIKGLYNSLTLCDSVKKKIEEFTDLSKKYAVRSSGIKEDLAGFSFAGQYDTFINVCGSEAIADAVLKCYLSTYSETVLSYFATNGIAAKDAEMAVIIEEMVDSEISGVAFTVNPTSGDDKEIFIEAVYGQGENLVSGKAHAERYAYNWWNEKITQKSSDLLSDEKIKKVAETALEIQMLFGYPCDIEFAFMGEELYILQARAITKILYGGIRDQWSTADFKDGGVSSTVCTAYMWSLYEFIWESELKAFILDSKILKPKELRKLGDMFYGRPYWNVSIVKAGMAKVPGYKERDFDSELGVKISYEGDGQTTPINIRSLLDIARIALEQSRIVRERRETAQNLKDELLTTYNDYFKNKDNEFTHDEIKEIWKKLIFCDYLKSESTYFRQIFINLIHQSLYKDKLLKHTDVGGYFSLIAGLDNVSHLLPFYELWNISRAIRDDEKSFAFWTSVASEKIASNIESAPYGDRVLEYVDRFGYHSKKELDVTYPSFYEDIESIVDDLKNTCVLGDDCSPETDSAGLHNAFEAEMERVRSKTSAREYKRFEKTVSVMRELLWWREEFRDISTRFYCVIRAYTIRLAEALLAENVIADLNEIWFVKIDDIKSFLDKKISAEEFRVIIKKNSRYYASFRNFENENEIGIAFSQATDKKQASSSGLNGIGCSRFVATGTARVINSLDETDRLREGDILITKFTDTGWTSKFALLGGIVTEYGGVLCHAAIVSREYGIPCVVCAENATKIINDGDVITINGETGEIIIGGEKK